MILSPPENESLKYSAKLDKVFINPDQNPLLKNFQILPLQRNLFGTLNFQNQLFWAYQ